MSEQGTGASGVNALAIVAILVLVLLAGWFVLKSGAIGGESKTLDVNIKAPAITEPAKAP